MVVVEEAGPTTVLVSDELVRPLARSFDMAFSAESALSSLSSRSCCTLRYLARLVAAISSYTTHIRHKYIHTCTYTNTKEMIDNIIQCVVD